MSRSSATRPVARVCQDTRERYRGWCERRLEEHDLVYLFLDRGLPSKLRPDDEPAEGVLVAWGVSPEGRKVLLGLALGSRGSHANRVRARLHPPWAQGAGLIVADGARGLWKAARELWPTAEEQRCTVHALRNVTGKLPERHHRQLGPLVGRLRRGRLTLGCAARAGRIRAAKAGSRSV